MFFLQTASPSTPCTVAFERTSRVNMRCWAIVVLRRFFFDPLRRRHCRIKGKGVFQVIPEMKQGPPMILVYAFFVSTKTRWDRLDCLMFWDRILDYRTGENLCSFVTAHSKSKTGPGGEITSSQWSSLWWGWPPIVYPMAAWPMSDGTATWPMQAWVESGCVSFTCLARMHLKHEHRRTICVYIF